MGLFMPRVLFLFTLLRLSYSLIDCDNVLKDSSDDIFIGLCNNKWSNLKKLVKPTQSEVGYAWVQNKLSDYDSKSNAQDEMDKNPIPAVIGPDHFFYIVDHHHELSAFEYSGFSDVTVTLNVICDHRLLPTMDAFWKYMDASHLVYLGAHPNGDPNALPIPITPDQLPQEFSFTKENLVFGDDPWRSLASFARKVNSHYLNSSDCDKTETKYCYRAYYRGCVDGSQPSGAGVAFYEFRWGYYFLDGSFHNPQYWSDPTQLNDFRNTFLKQESGEMGSFDLDDWLYTASLVVPLARSNVVESYHPPATLFTPDTTLPGFVVGSDVPILNDDPECNSPLCSDEAK
jgi:hypothetical protein